MRRGATVVDMGAMRARSDRVRVEAEARTFAGVVFRGIEVTAVVGDPAFDADRRGWLEARRDMFAAQQPEFGRGAEGTDMDPLAVRLRLGEWVGGIDRMIAHDAGAVAAVRQFVLDNENDVRHPVRLFVGALRDVLAKFALH